MATENIREQIIIKGAKKHNLKDINLNIPREKFVVLTGVSGSGKSSLAFDTIYAEGQRRYVESLSSYARQFMDQMDKPEVELIEGLSPAISISQKTTSYNPRSTVGTVTEIYDFLRVLFARIGVAHCPKCGREIYSQTVSHIVDQISERYQKEDILILAPIVRDRKGEYQKELLELRRTGYSRVRIDYEIKRLDELEEEDMILSRYYRHTIEVIVDRITVSVDEKDRLAEAVEQAINLADGLVGITTSEAAEKKEKQKKKQKTKTALKIDDEMEEELFSIHLACPKCNISFPKLEPRNFSFNSAHGACPQCKGLGTTIEIDPDILIVDKDLSIAEGAFANYDPKRENFRHMRLSMNMMKKITKHLGFTIDTPLKNITKKQWNAFFYGEKDPMVFKYDFSWGKEGKGAGRGIATMEFKGLAQRMKKRYKETSSHNIRKKIQTFTSLVPCKKCNGTGLRVESRSVTFKGKTIANLAKMSIDECKQFFETIKLTETEKNIAQELLKEIKLRLNFLVNVGLSYLSLSRRANTLSGGESQRIRLGTQIGSGLENVLYVLDEPSIGLHHRDNRKLIRTLQELRDKGNTVLVSEHDIDTMLAADWLIDMGPFAGIEGGEILESGPAEQIISNNKSITGKYLLGEEYIPIPEKRREGNGKKLTIYGAAENNLKKIDVSFPLEKFICVTGVSGSGKSSLVTEIVWKALAKKLNRAEKKAGKHEKITGIEHLDKVIEIDQSPIGYTPRSVPATYTKVLDHIRKFYASLPISQARGFKKGRFSFNTKSGRCQACKGLGYKKVEMQFLPDMKVKCEICQGKRFSPETLQVKYKAKSIHDVFEMTVQEALEFFKDHPKIKRILRTLKDVGLDYIKLGQPSPTLSGGEAQRVKISRELSKRSTGQTLYLLEEPTVGLHSYDVKKLLNVLNRLVEAGNTVIVIEHNLDVIKSADWVIDLGPEGGENGGKLITEGSPEEIAKCEKSYTGEALQIVLKTEEYLDEITKAKKLREKPVEEGDKAIKIENAYKNNLKNINVDIPKNKLTIITGVSGSGKSSLALDTLFAEGQRRFVESLSTYARQFLGSMDSGEVGKISGLSPAIAMDQKSAGRTPRSTVGTVTEINDYLRLLFATVGITYCPICSKDMTPLTLQEMVKRTLELKKGTKIRVLAPVVHDSKGNFKPLVNELIKDGFTRILIDNKHEVYLEEVKFSKKENDAKNFLDKNTKHTLDLVVDRLIIKENIKEQLYDSIETALQKSDGVVKIATNGISKIFSTKRECFKHGISLPEKIPPKMFSFNSHIGACVKCDGLGIIKTIDPEALIVDKKLSIIEGAIGPISRSSNHVLSLLESVGKKFDFKLDTPLEKFTEEQMNILLYGTQKKLRYQRDVSRKNYSYTYTKDIKFKGLIQQYQEWLRKTTSLYFIRKMEKYTKIQQCPVCKGARLKPTSLAVRVGGLNLEQILECSIKEAYEFFTNLSFGGSKKIVADRIIEEITTRLQFLKNVGLDYLTLNREATTLSGGEAQRIRLATQIGNKLVGVLYVLNEPSIGLHARDIDRLIKTLEELRDLGNTVVIIEHDENTIRNADNIIDLGPGAGVKGGEVVSTGSFKELLENSKSITAKYLNGELTIPLPKTRRRKKGSLLLEGVQHNNLKNINVEFPLGILTCVSGVSGSGKSSLVIEVLYRILAKEYHRAKTLPGKYTKIDGLENLDKVILINQNPIGRSSRSNPATYTGVFDHIRELYANLPESQLRGYTISRYSFNNSEGRCSVCKGKGTKEIEMLFLSNVEITCEECKGKRYNRETLKVKFKGKSIADVLEMTVNDALQFFSNQPKIAEILQIMVDVGIGYMQLGQSASTLSGGEAQRVKLASELCRPQTSRTLYILDEPTVGLSAYDIDKLLQILNRLIEQGNSVIIIEHNLNVIKSADWVIDLGPEGGEAGGEVVIEGTPEDIMKSKKSITGQYLKAFLKQQEKRVKTKEIKELKDTRAEVFEKT